jgi:hypothetical protein
MLFIAPFAYQLRIYLTQFAACRQHRLYKIHRVYLQKRLQQNHTKGVQAASVTPAIMLPQEQMFYNQHLIEFSDNTTRHKSKLFNHKPKVFFAL